MSNITRNEAFELLREYNKDSFHIRHALTVEGVMKYFAEKLGYEDEKESWGIVGLLHIEDISVSRIKSPEERFKIGQNIKVMIKSIDRDNNRIELTHKELLGTWDENVQSYQEGERVQGIIKETEKQKNGIFVELKPNLVGLAEYKDGYEYGQKVDVYIKKIVKDKKKIKLLIVS